MDEAKHPEALPGEGDAQEDSRPDKSQSGKTPIYVHPRLRALIRELSEATGKSYGELVGVALRVLKTVLDRSEKGQELAFLKDGKVVQTILLLM